MFDRADANDDGVITEDEVPAGVWDRLVAADADANSSVTQEELQTYLDNLHNEGDRPEHHPHHDHGLPPNIDPAALFARVDVNEDLLITEDEVPAAIWDKLLAADTDSSSSITLTELETYIDTLVADLPQREPPHHGHDRGPRHNHGPGNLANGIPVSPEALFSPIDKNGDGSLTEDEVPAVLWNRLVAADANSDGSVTLDEINEYIAGQTSPSQQTSPSAPTGQLAQGGVNTRVAGRLRR